MPLFLPSVKIVNKEQIVEAEMKLQILKMNLWPVVQQISKLPPGKQQQQQQQQQLSSAF